jgi:thymidylate synthase ThyX
MIKAELIKDSVSPAGVRLSTFVLTYPRFIHAEFMTHRMLSRNASSSRAIPVHKFMEAITQNPAMPISFSKNCKGMQAKEAIENQDDAIKIWLEARDAMMGFVQRLSDLGVHKQHANRLLEPFQHITVIASATDWANFFGLRCHPDAQPEFQALASDMWSIYSSQQPKELIEGEWHLPFVTDEEFNELRRLFMGTESDYFDLLKTLTKRSVARCARVSYNTHDGSANTIEKDVELYDRLVAGEPLHASPTEHQAMALADGNRRSGNFNGWSQYRKTLRNENIVKFQGY